MNKLLLTLGTIVLGLVVAFSFVILVSGERTAQATSPSATVISTATTSAAFSVTTSTRILATTTNPLGTPGVTSFTRVYASICNMNANPVVLNLDIDKIAKSSGGMTAVIAAAAGYNTCYEITDRNLYSGSVTASSTNETSTSITVKEYVQ